MPKTLLVTGARGLVGGRLLRLLRGNAAWQVIGLTRSSNLDASADNISFANIDWRDDGQIDRYCNEADAIIHLATMNEQECEKNPEQALVDNGLLTLRLVNAAVRNDVKRFIYVSTAKVYGENLQGNVTEKTLPLPLNHYAITHRISESYVQSAHLRTDMDGVVFRLSNGVGAPVDAAVDCWSLITNNFCLQAIEERKIVLQSTGKQLRNFMALEDVVRALAFALDMPIEQGQKTLYNLGGKTSMSIIDMAHCVAERCEALYGFRPEVQSKIDEDEVIPPLRYERDEFESLGYAFQDDLIQEIDNLLNMRHDIRANALN